MSAAPFRLGERFDDGPVGPITIDHVRAFARASGDDNAIHLDPAAARRIGLTAPPVHGMQLVALMHEAASRHLPSATVTGLSTRFLAPVPVGSSVAVSGRVVKVDTGPEGPRAVLRLFLRTETGALASLGEATLAAADP
jgi:acyl dehydratase